MSFNQISRRIPAGLVGAVWVLCFAAVAILAPPARAEIENAGFSMTISEKEDALDDSVDLEMMKFLMWDLSFDRIVARNMPYIEIRNDDDSDAPLTELRLTIGDEKFHFECEFIGACAIPGKTTPNVDLTSFVEDNGDLLVVQFGDGGLDPGEHARLKIHLGVDPMYEGLIYANPDFRTVLFDMNGRNVYLNDPDGVGSDDNASFWAKFEMEGMEPLVTGPKFLEDPIVVGAAGQYYNQSRRPYGVMEEVDQFRFLSVVPEPSSIGPVAVGLLAGLLLRRLRARQPAAMN